MSLRFNTCPHCNQRIVFRIETKDIDPTQYPAPIYIFHNIKSCGKTSTFYVDSLLRVSYKELEKKPGGITTLEINK
jgi:DNA-directed RNA polymerase subunit RPC12/RpoP